MQCIRGDEEVTRDKKRFSNRVPFSTSLGHTAPYRPSENKNSRGSSEAPRSFSRAR